MGYYTFLNLNLLVNQNTTYSVTSKLYTKMLFKKMINEIEQKAKSIWARKNIKLIDDDNMYIVANFEFKNYDHELSKTLDIINRYFPESEGIIAHMEENEKTPHITLKMKEESQIFNSTVIPRLTFAYDTDLEKEDRDMLFEVYNNWDNKVGYDDLIIQNKIDQYTKRY